jgi:hypothetical protein
LRLPVSHPVATMKKMGALQIPATGSETETNSRT